MGGLKTTKSSLSWEVLKKVKEEKEDSFRRNEQSSLTNHRQQLLALQVAFITTITKNPKYQAKPCVRPLTQALCKQPYTSLL